MRVVLLALLVTVAACGKKKEGDASSTKTTETKPADTEAAKPADPTTPPPSAPAAGAAVDTCELVSKDQVKTILGADPEEPEKSAATGSMLGGCSWKAADFKLMLTAQARPATEFQATADYAKEKKEVAGVGEKAYWTESGMFVQPAGKPYFLHVMAIVPGQMKPDEAKSTELAKALVAGAK